VCTMAEVCACARSHDDARQCAAVVPQAQGRSGAGGVEGEGGCRRQHCGGGATTLGGLSASPVASACGSTRRAQKSTSVGGAAGTGERERGEKESFIASPTNTSGPLQVTVQWHVGGSVKSIEGMD
jgi:hypothetical protein